MHITPLTVRRGLVVAAAAGFGLLAACSPAGSKFRLLPGNGPGPYGGPKARSESGPGIQARSEIGPLGDAEAADLTQRDYETLSAHQQSALQEYYAQIMAEVNPSVFRTFLNESTTPNPGRRLQGRGEGEDEEYVMPPPCLEKGDLNRCAAVHVNKGVPGGVKVWNIMIEENYRYDDICGRSILKKFRSKCNSFPVWVKNWRCDRIDYLFYGTNVNVPWGTVWINFITRSSCQEEWAEKWIAEISRGEVQPMCIAMTLDQLPSPLDFKEMRTMYKPPQQGKGFKGVKGIKGRSPHFPKSFLVVKCQTPGPVPSSSADRCPRGP